MMREFDPVNYLTDEASIQAYLNDMLAEGTPAEFVQALNDVARARGMNDLAAKTGIARTSLYKTLSSEKPRFDTILKIIHGLGLQMTLSSVVDNTELSDINASDTDTKKAGKPNKPI